MVSYELSIYTMVERKEKNKNINEQDVVIRRIFNLDKLSLLHRTLFLSYL